MYVALGLSGLATRSVSGEGVNREVQNQGIPLPTETFAPSRRAIRYT